MAAFLNLAISRQGTSPEIDGGDWGEGQRQKNRERHRERKGEEREKRKERPGPLKPILLGQRQSENVPLNSQGLELMRQETLG